MKTFFLPFICLLMLISCSESKPTPAPVSEKSFFYFEARLKKEMNYGSLVATFGQPAKDIGSGIHIYVYVLEDATQIWIGYADKILYAHHVDSSGKLIKTLI
jgi:hypothetical protein